jgi:nicotinate-nucleotide adenylyltransferase
VGTVGVTKLGLMGGTFDPIHHGHLVAAEEARYALGLERVLFIPAGTPWQKESGPVTPADQRLEMTKLAIADNEFFEVSRVELDREGRTYTIETLQAVREQVAPGAELFFVTGADAILQILTWKDPEEALALATFVAVSRPGHDLHELEELGVSDRVVRLEIPALAISSTDIRRRVAAGRPIRYLVPEQVRRYIEEQGLYRA